MAPTITSTITYSKEDQTLTNKLRKPMVEKLRRDRINNSIEQLKSLLGPEILNQQPDSKMEKADILEMTVCLLRRQQQQRMSTTSHLAAVNQGFSKCVQETVHFLSQDEVKTQSQRKLLSHFQKLQPSSDDKRGGNVPPQLSSPAQQTISTKKSLTKGALWRPW